MEIFIYEGNKLNTINKNNDIWFRAKTVASCSVCEVHFVIANMKYLGAQSGMGFLIIKAWRIQFSCVLFVYNNPIPSVSIRRWNTTIGDEDKVLSSTY